MIFPKTVLTAHARARLAERSNLSGESLIEMFNRQLGRKVGCTTQRSHLAHRLFWSHEDDAFFIAIQDVVTGDVVTIVTEAMYENWYQGQITESQRRKVINDTAAAGYGPARLIANTKMHCSISAKFMSSKHPKLLGRWSGNVASQDIMSLEAHQSFWEWVIERLRLLGLPLETLEAIVAAPSDGELTQIRFRYAC